MNAGLALERGERLRLAALGACLVASLALYGALAVVLGSPPVGQDGIVGFSLPSAPMFRAFTGLPAVAFSPANFARDLTAVLVLLWILWGAALLALRGLSTAKARRLAKWIILCGAGAMLALVVVAVPPLLSGDLYRQAIYGHMVGHGLNPYATPASAASGDPLFAFANQCNVTTIYGAAYTWLSALAVALAPASPLGAALAWKTTAALAALGCALLAAPVARALAGGPGESENGSDGREAQLWLAWNPLVVIEAAASGHIEPIMMLPALGGILLLQRRQPVRGFLMLVVSTLTKWVTGVLLLLAAVREVRRAEPGRRLRTALRLAGAGALLAAVLYAPFAAGLSTQGGIHELAVSGAGALGGASHGVPEWAMMAGFAALAVAVTPFATAGDSTRLVAAGTALLIVFIVFVVPWLFPWYFVAPIVLGAVLPAGRTGAALRFVGVGLGAGVMLYYAKLVPLR